MTDHSSFERLVEAMAPGAKLVKATPLTGGVSALIHVLEVTNRDGSKQQLVVRQSQDHDWKARAETSDSLKRSVSAIEFDLLAELARHSLPVPTVRWLDDSGKTLPLSFYVMDRIAGSTDLLESDIPLAVGQMAAFLARLHSIDPQDVAVEGLPRLEDPAEGALRYLPADSDAWLKEKLEELAGETTGGRHEPQLSVLHGDFWPGNVLWKDGQLAAVIDWEDASIGDPLSDVACCRVELLCLYGSQGAEEKGINAMNLFTECYLEAKPQNTERLAVWEIYVSASALASMSEWGLEPEIEKERRRLTQSFFERAAEQLRA